MSNPSKTIEKLDGWVLESLVEMSADEPEFAAVFISSPPEMRSALMLCIARMRREDSGPMQWAAFARRVRISTPPALVEHEFGVCPTGLIGVLSRLDVVPPITIFLRLFDEARERSARWRTLEQLSGTITGQQMMMVLFADPVMVAASIVDRFAGDRDQAHRVGFLALIRAVCSTATDESLRRSLTTSTQRFSDWALGWIRRFDRLPYVHPIPADDSRFRALTSGADLIEAAQMMRNCLVSRVPLVALGKCAYAITRARPHIVVELRALQRGWLLTQMEGCNGHAPDRDTLVELCAYLAQFNVQSVKAFPVALSSAVSEFVGADFFDIDIAEFPLPTPVEDDEQGRS